MEINGNNRPIDPGSRKRQLEAGKVSASNAAGAAHESESAHTPEQIDGYQALSSEEIQRYVDILKTFDPVDHHKVDELRQRIARGEYTLSPGDLAQRLADLLSRSGPAA
jgi:flagellar biosynthesis anti-sigma factor FlgM